MTTTAWLILIGLALVGGGWVGYIVGYYKGWNERDFSAKEAMKALTIKHWGRGR